MLAAIITTVLYTAASALVPALPAEPYLVGLVAATDHSPVALGIAAGIGQSAGKVVIFLAARGTIRSPWLRRRLSRLTAMRAETVGAATPAAAGTAATSTATPEAVGAGTPVAAGTVADSPVLAEPPPPGRFAGIRRAAGATGRVLAGWTPSPLRRLGSAAGRLTSAASAWLTRALDRPVVAALTVFASAVIGLPPLIATTVYASVTRMSVTLFGTVCVIGRSIRFIAIAIAPTLIM